MSNSVLFMLAWQRSLSGQRAIGSLGKWEECQCCTLRRWHDQCSSVSLALPHKRGFKHISCRMLNHRSRDPFRWDAVLFVQLCYWHYTQLVSDGGHVRSVWVSSKSSLKIHTVEKLYTHFEVFCTKINVPFNFIVLESFKTLCSLILKVRLLS